MAKGRGKSRGKKPSNKEHLTGDWDDIAEFMEILPAEAEDRAEEVLKCLAEEVAGAVKTNIENQSYPHAPLSEAYTDYKFINSLDGRILIATGFYLSQIGAYYDGSEWFAGVPDLPHSSGIPLPDLWNWLEFGTEKMPARPHITIEMARMEVHMKKCIEDQGFEFLGEV